MSNEQKPVAWMFREPDGSIKFVLHDADRAAAWGRDFKGMVIPLYEKPQGKQA
jgi:hypothetical protein